MMILERLKSKNRTLLEMHIGILFFGLLCQVAGAFLVENQWYYAKSLWFGNLIALVASTHMSKTLERAMGYGDNAQKIVSKGFIVRYVMAIIIFIVIGVTEVMNILVVFLGYMSLKVTAYLQPLTHKLCNWFFHETDPEPEPMAEEDVGQVDGNL